MNSSVWFLAIVVSSMTAVASAAAQKGSQYLDPQLMPDRDYSNVFSISRSVRADGYDELVRRNGGSADYSISSATAGSLQFRIAYRYDGQPAAEGSGEIRENGRTTCNNGKCAPNTDASGPVYNPALWGTPPQLLYLGQKWLVRMNEPWELGGRNSTETVTVVGLDSKTATATLMREGASEGFFLDEPKQLSLTRDAKTFVFDLIPGTAHWCGYTTFRRGVVVSDELVVTRADTLRSSEGTEIVAHERRIMLLNAAPPAMSSSRLSVLTPWESILETEAPA
jgi:hypothetical protein